MKKIVLDTNCYAAFLSGDAKVLEALAAAEIVFLSVFVLGELFAGFKGGNREAANRELLERFLRKPTVQALNATAETAAVFGQIKAALKKAGTPLPINDVWIAAHAVETGATLVSYDSHFEKIIGLKIWQPSAT
ncbi:MAG: PIN domain-containing protein [Desulfobulbia bacterium]